MTLVQKYKLSTSNNIALIHINDFSGHPCYFYVLVKNVKKPLLDKVTRNSQIKVADFGKVVCWGYGGQPSEEDALFMQDKYGFKSA